MGIHELRARQAAILYENDTYGRNLRDAFRSAFESAGGSIVDARPYVEELPSFDPFLRVLRRQGGTDVLLISGGQNAAQRIVPTLDSVRLRTRVMGSDRLRGLRRTPAQYAGVLISSAYLPDRPTPRNQSFVEEFAANNDGSLPDHVAAGTFDAVHLLARAISETGPDREAIQVYLASVGRGTAPYEGVTGTIRFDDAGGADTKELAIGVLTRAGLTTAGGS